MMPMVRMVGFEPAPRNPLAFRQPGQCCMVHTRTLNLVRELPARGAEVFFAAAPMPAAGSGLKISSRDAYVSLLWP
jgi:hypothetical protein